MMLPVEPKLALAASKGKVFLQSAIFLTGWYCLWIGPRHHTAHRGDSLLLASLSQASPLHWRHHDAETISNWSWRDA